MKTRLFLFREFWGGYRLVGGWVCPRPTRKRSLRLVSHLTATTVLLLTLFSAPVFAQDPCATPVTTTVYNPAAIVFQSDDYGATLPLSTTPMWDKVVIGHFLDTTAASPISESEIDRTAFALVSGTTNCYRAPIAFAAVPTNARVSAVKVKRTTVEPAESPWSAKSNPFAQLAALSAPVAVRRTK